VYDNGLKDPVFCTYSQISWSWESSLQSDETQENASVFRILHLQNQNSLTAVEAQSKIDGLESQNCTNQILKKLGMLSDNQFWIFGKG